MKPENIRELVLKSPEPSLVEKIGQARLWYAIIVLIESLYECFADKRPASTNNIVVSIWSAGSTSQFSSVDDKRSTSGVVFADTKAFRTLEQMQYGIRIAKIEHRRLME